MTTNTSAATISSRWKHVVNEYYQLTKPGIVWSNAMSAAAGYFLAVTQPSWGFSVKTLIGLLFGLVMVVACSTVLNNYLDRGIDLRMKRTKQRALAAGRISARSAIVFAAILGIAGFAALFFLTNLRVVALGVVGLVFYVVVYGFAKRKTVHGTLIGTVSGAVPLAAGYVAATNRFDLGALLLFLILVCWQMPHFLAISLLRLEDYRAAGLPLTPIVRGIRRAKLEVLLYVFGFIIFVELLSVLGFAGLSFLVVMSAVGLYWLWLGVKGFDRPDVKRWGGQMFGFSLSVLLVLIFMLSLGNVLP